MRTEKKMINKRLAYNALIQLSVCLKIQGMKYPG